MKGKKLLQPASHSWLIPSGLPWRPGPEWVSVGDRGLRNMAGVWLPFLYALANCKKLPEAGMFLGDFRVSAKIATGLINNLKCKDSTSVEVWGRDYLRVWIISPQQVPCPPCAYQTGGWSPHWEQDYLKFRERRVPICPAHFSSAWLLQSWIEFSMSGRLRIPWLLLGWVATKVGLSHSLEIGGFPKQEGSRVIWLKPEAQEAWEFGCWSV